MKRFLLIFFLFSFGRVFSQDITGGHIHLITYDSLHNNIHDIASGWKFKQGDDTAYAQISCNDSGWSDVSSYLYEKEVNQYKVDKKVAWFRGRYSVDSSLLDKPFVIFLDGIGAADIYIDGQRMRRVAGEFDSAGHHKYYNLDKFPVFVSYNTPGVHLIAFRYENVDFRKCEDDYWGAMVKVATPDMYLLNTYTNQKFASVILFGITALFFTLGIIHLLLFLFYRKEMSNLYFSLFNIAFAGLFYIIFRYFFQFAHPFSHIRHITLYGVFCGTIACYAIIAFINTIFSKKRFFLTVAFIVCMAFLTCTLFIDFDTTLMSGWLAVIAIGTALYTVISIVIALVKRKKGAGILGIGILFSVLFFSTFAVSTFFVDEMSITTDTIGGQIIVALVVLSIFSLPLSISAFLAWRFAHTSKDLNRQLLNVEKLSKEKQQILERQNEKLEAEVEQRTLELVKEKQKSDDLLLNILPQEVADELKEKGESKAHYYDEVTVLFTDFVNFTAISEKLGVEELLEELNVNFTAFDRIMEKYGLEKIKTIGDAYLAVSGLPNKNEHHAQNAVQAALDILGFVEKRKTAVPYGLDIRIGINSGSLVAGIIGVKKFAYDIWGDTVNTAARMEQSSEAGKINISVNTYELIKESFDCLYRGKINAKGKGAIDMYFVRGKK